MRPVAGQLLAQRYQLERPLASGGMGTIWVAKHLLLDVPVAVKFMSEDQGLGTSGRARFEREAKAAARLTSPHVVRAYDYGVEDGTPYMAMELLSGESLEARITSEGRLALDVAAAIFRQIAKGLHEAHELGIVHRDLKPANIFLAQVGDEEVVKILDFGIAKETKGLIVDDRTQSGTLLGSPHHMSPEQARGGDVDTRSDLWSLGVVLFRAVSGHRPFSGTNVGDVIAKICGDEIPAPSRFDPGLGGPIDAFFARALTRNPDLRFQSVREMAAAFDVSVGCAVSSRSTFLASEDSLSFPSGDAEVVPRNEVTRDVAARTSVADIESTAIGTTSAPIGRATRNPYRRYALGALLVAMAAGGVVLSYAHFVEPPRGEAHGRPVQPASISAKEGPPPEPASTASPAVEVDVADSAHSPPPPSAEASARATSTSPPDARKTWPHAKTSPPRGTASPSPSRNIFF